MDEATAQWVRAQVDGHHAQGARQHPPVAVKVRVPERAHPRMPTRSTPALSSRRWDGRPETYVTNPRGYVLGLPKGTLSGAEPDRTAKVWLTDRRCRWICPCSCHTAAEWRTDTLF